MRIRTSNLLIRSQMLYPIELRALFPFQEPHGVAVTAVYTTHPAESRQNSTNFEKFCIFLFLEKKRLALQPSHLYNAPVPAAKR